MAKDRINMEKEQQEHHSNFFWWFLVIVGGGIVIFLAFVIMFRINYKVRALREGFWSVFGWTALVILIVVLLTILGLRLLNVTSRQGYEEDIYDDEETERIIKEEQKKKRALTRKRKKKRPTAKE